MRINTLLKLIVLNDSMTFSLFILWLGMVAIDLSCKENWGTCQTRDAIWPYGGLTTMILFHSYLGLGLFLHQNRKLRD